MGWASAGDIFRPVAQKMIDVGFSEAQQYVVCDVLIKALQAGDWDTEGESLNDFSGCRAIVAAFAANGIIGFDPEDY